MRKTKLTAAEIIKKAVDGDMMHQINNESRVILPKTLRKKRIISNLLTAGIFCILMALFFTIVLWLYAKVIM